MARTKNQKNGQLEEAMKDLVQSQASLVQTQSILTQAHAKFLADKAETDRQIAETNRINGERFLRIEATLAEIFRMIQRLPEAVRDKIGFKTAP
jgi:hypothetical protein